MVYVKKQDVSLKRKRRYFFGGDFEMQTGHQILIWTDLVLFNKKKRTCNLVDFAVPVDSR